MFSRGLLQAQDYTGEPMHSGLSATATIPFEAFCQKRGARVGRVLIKLHLVGTKALLVSGQILALLAVHLVPAIIAQRK